MLYIYVYIYIHILNFLGRGLDMSGAVYRRLENSFDTVSFDALQLRTRLPDLQAYIDELNQIIGEGLRVIEELNQLALSGL